MYRLLMSLFVSSSFYFFLLLFRINSFIQASLNNHIKTLHIIAKRKRKKTVSRKNWNTEYFITLVFSKIIIASFATIFHSKTSGRKFEQFCESASVHEIEKPIDFMLTFDALSLVLLYDLQGKSTRMPHGKACHVKRELLSKLLHQESNL